MEYMEMKLKNWWRWKESREILDNECEKILRGKNQLRSSWSSHLMSLLAGCKEFAGVKWHPSYWCHEYATGDKLSLSWWSANRKMISASALRWGDKHDSRQSIQGIFPLYTLHNCSVLSKRTTVIEPRIFQISVKRSVSSYTVTDFSWGNREWLRGNSHICRSEKHLCSYTSFHKYRRDSIQKPPESKTHLDLFCSQK